MCLHYLVKLETTIPQLIANNISGCFLMKHGVHICCLLCTGWTTDSLSATVELLWLFAIFHACGVTRFFRLSTWLHIFVPAPRGKRAEKDAAGFVDSSVFLGCPVVPFARWFVGSFVRSSAQILLPRYLVNGLSYLHEAYREYSLAPTDDLIRFWRS